MPLECRLESFTAAFDAEKGFSRCFPRSRRISECRLHPAQKSELRAHQMAIHQMAIPAIVAQLTVTKQPNINEEACLSESLGTLSGCS